MRSLVVLRNSGVSHLPIPRLETFKECFNHCNLIDIGFKGSKFTRSNLCNISGLIQERIDYTFVNLSVRLQYPNALVTHLHRIRLNHYPLLIYLENHVWQKWNRPFHFQLIWFYHLDFKHILDNFWTKDCSLLDTIDPFKDILMQWNHNSFGNIFKKKSQLLAHIVGAKKALVEAPSDHIINLHKFLLEELNFVLREEELICALKSHPLFPTVNTTPFCLLDSPISDAESQKPTVQPFQNVQSGRSLHKLKRSPIKGLGRKRQPRNAEKR
ncbi:hypothetical protein CXB51_023951 [Gossypium anomalum]|uniref:Uncharacterized protein n=1 Tax=Gossypium anomalum TaxID=47600 RepID=A0A8J6CPM1_9ROSI|nr:hypothetical protein CXB51_023951 [Gossypium anomalum]